MDIPAACKPLIRVSIQQQSFDLAEECRQLAGDIDVGEVGAQASFIGLVRGSEPAAAEQQAIQRPSQHANQTIQALFIEHYPAMTQASIEAICLTACERWPICQARVIHRIGRLAVGEAIVMVLVTASHREAAFAACEYIMDYRKTSAPFWKKAIFNDSEHWVSAKHSDQQALSKWQR